MIKYLGEDDRILIAQACDIAHQFIEESDRPVTYDVQNAVSYMMSFILSPEAEVIVDVVDGQVLGGAIVGAFNEAHKEKFGYLVKFYVRPEHRNTRTAIRLMKACNDYFDSNDCVQCFCTATAGVGRDDAYIRLCEKFGYKQSTPILIREA